ncbi:hypothetical protein GCM10010885_19930 [Alicyclobacillus cellulosilyticus]|uniref:ABC transporter substrate-binding protein PnrA-like domain-containing protein n=1 Tax=Alicyclobacillus cellulosilyticus TaxID=1003997 RepID=A0A917KFW2_9BACL|nr:BMP family ABC transporter substrate-binding protein [Alicyclobacillus cellulosilyticus]GGJ10710.1 hypothetical protein GCM10010885_19930 [Alicyclobacillus cellulosilyticus]
MVKKRIWSRVSMIFSVVLAVMSPGVTSFALAKQPKTVKVAFVYDGPANDGGWSSAQDAGRKYLVKMLGVKTTYVENVPESADSERVFEQLAQQGYNVIFGTSYGYMNYMADVAPKYPNVIFLNCGGYKTAPNMGTYFGKNFELKFDTTLDVTRVCRPKFVPHAL